MYDPCLEGTPNVLPSIVFIHGFGKDREATWTAEGATEPWLKTLLASTFPAARILTFGYDPHIDSNKGVALGYMIEDWAQDLLVSLSSLRNEDGMVSKQFSSMTNILTGTYRMNGPSYLCHMVLGGHVCQAVRYGLGHEDCANATLGLVHDPAGCTVIPPQYFSPRPRHYVHELAKPWPWT